MRRFGTQLSHVQRPDFRVSPRRDSRRRTVVQSLHDDQCCPRRVHDGTPARIADEHLVGLVAEILEHRPEGTLEVEERGHLLS